MKPDQLIHAFSTTFPSDLQDEIQYMPPGEHEITALTGDKPIELKVKVTAASATALQTALAALDKPYFDFNHEDGPASGHVTAFTWGGDDPLKGGVRAKVEWTEPGKAALSGRAFRKFSPSFFVNANGEVTGAPMNMGGLVNRPAFKTIAPIWSREGGQVTNPIIDMDPKDKELADLKTAFTEVNAKLAAATNDTAIKAKDAEINALKSKIITMEQVGTERLKLDAKSAVAGAVALGKIPSQNTELQGHYEAMYVANPDATKAILASLPANPALATVVHAGSGQTMTQGTQVGEHPFLIKAREVSTARKITLIEATTAVAAEQPALYEAYRKG